MASNYKRVNVFFDESDPANKGWAYAAVTVDGDHESGPLDDCDDAKAAVLDAAILLDLDDDAQNIMVWKFHQENGGFWQWSAQ